MQNTQTAERKVLFVSSFTEFCERYNYYMIQGLLIFYLIYHFHISENTSASLVGTVIGVLYISAIVGGYIADKLLTYYTAAFLGSFLMLVGTGCLAVSSSKHGLFLGLSFVAISTGLIKSNMSSFIGQFYDKSGLSDSHRDFGFNIFYVGINLGSFCALFAASYLRAHYGFAMSFYSSFVLIVLMCFNLWLGKLHFNQYEAKINFNPILCLKLITIIGLYIAFVFAILSHQALANTVIFLAALLCGVILFKSAQNKHWPNVGIALGFFGLSILYWSLYFQIFISILLFIDSTVVHHLFSWKIQSTQFISAESVGVLAFGAIMGKIWLSFGRRNRPIHDIDKFNLAFVIMTLSFIIYYGITAFGNLHAKVPALGFIIAMVILAISELSLSAIGLSCVTKIAPRGFVSLYMSIWLVTIGIGGKIGGEIASTIAIDSNNIYTSRTNMAHGFLLFIGMAIGGSIICTILRKPIMAAKILR